MLAAWAAIKLFVSGNWVHILKWGAIVLVACIVWWKVDTAYDNYKAAIEAEKVAFTQMSIDKLAAEVERDRARQAVATLLQQREMLAQVVEETLEQQRAVQQEYEDRIAVFEGHDLERIANSNHQEWLSKLANEATAKYFQELENAFNE